MAQTIARGGVITLVAFYRDGSNDLADPDDPKISIVNTEGTTVVSLDDPTHISVGHFEYEYPVAADALLGAWAARWFGTIDGSGVEDEDGFTVIPAGALTPPDGTPLIFVPDFAAFIRLPIDTIDVDAANEAIQGASDLVRDELGQVIDFVADDVVQVESPGGKLVLLPEVPVVDVTLVRVRRPGGDWEILTAGTDYEAVLGRAAKIWRIGSSEWPRATGRGLDGFIEVTNSHGYNTPTANGADAEDLPSLLATVVKRVAARGYQNPEAVSQETTGRGNTTVYSNPGLYLSDGDKRDLERFRPGSRGGSR